VAQRLRPQATLLNEVLTDLRDRGGVESLLLYAYNGAAFTARYDAISHIGPTRLILPDCSGFATSPLPGCSANFGSTASLTSRSRQRTRGRSRPVAPAQTGSPAPTPSQRGRTPLDQLLDPLRGLLPQAGQAIPNLPGRTDEGARGALDDLLGYLMKR
jgi:hypothetical protein